MRPLNTLIALAITASSISANAQTPESPPTVVDPVSQSYATSYGVDLSEANRRLALLSKIVDLDARLRAQAGDSYAGLYVEHTPKFRVMVRFIGDAAANLRAVTSDPLFESQSAAVTLKSLETAHARVTDLLARLGIDFEGDVNVRANGVSIFTLNDGTARSALTSLLTAFPFLNLKQVSALPKRTATILGGKEATGTTIRCTTGFNVQNSSAVRGTTTAGHCDNSIAVGGTSLTFQSERYTGSYDVQWHAKSGQTFPNQIYTGSGNMAITSVYAAKSLPIGWQV